MIITHPSGVVTIYDAAYMRKLQKSQEKQRDEKQKNVTDIDEIIALIGSS